MTARAIVWDGAGGETIGGGPTRVRFLAGAPDAAVAVVDCAVPPGFAGPVPHRHAAMTDAFYVLEGALTFTVDGAEHRLGPGGFVLAPPGVVHAFANPGPEPARFLNIYQPAGLERYVKAVAARMAAGDPPTPEEMAGLAAGHDFEPAAAGTDPAGGG